MLSMKPCRRSEIAWRVIEDEAVVVNPRSGLVYPFNPVATRFWELMDGQHTISEIAGIIVDEFDANKEQVETDLVQFAVELEEKGLVDGMQNPALREV